MLEPDGEIPDDRCGFVLQPEQIGLRRRKIYSDKSMAYIAELITCVRETWKDGRCMWHADVSNKSVSELQSLRTESEKCLDGAILDETEWPDSVSFEN